MCRQADDFDIIHFHLDLLHFPLVTGFADRTPTVCTVASTFRTSSPSTLPFPDVPLVSISDSQRLPMPSVRWVGTVPHGLPQELLPFREYLCAGYLAFLGRISAEKRPDRAIDIAARAGIPLKIAAKIDKADRAYWDTVVAPLISRHRNVEFVGQVNEAQKAEFLGNALGLLFPIDWPEPFGLVMIEAMACGVRRSSPSGRARCPRLS